MKKRIVSLVLTLAMVFGMLTTFASAATAGMSNFKKSSTYPTGKFADVTADKWYAGSVKDAYEYGLVVGTSDAKFSPNNNLSLAQILVIACRLHSIYYSGSTNFVQGKPWYQVYVDYAIQNGIITANMFSNYNATATRAQVAIILCNALPAEALPAINTVDDGTIPDIHSYDSWCKAVYTLYRAGIVNGVGDTHIYNPANSIRRSEIAAIVTRMADPSTRVSVSMTDPNAAKGSLTLNKTSLTLEVGKQEYLTATFNPSSAQESVTWTSSDTSVATVSSSGRVVAEKEGVAIVTASTKSGLKATCTVIVTEKAIDVSSVRLDKSSISLMVGSSETLAITVLPDNATDKTVTWTSSNTSVARVDDSGRVTAMGKGTATITATAGKRSANCTVNVIDISVPKLDYEYGPMTLTDYYSSGGILQQNKISSLKFTKIEPSGSSYKISFYMAGVSTGTVLNKVRFYSSSGSLLGEGTMIFVANANTPYEKLDSFFVEKSVVDNAASIEFYSQTGNKAVPGTGSSNPDPVDPTPSTKDVNYLVDYITRNGKTNKHGNKFITMDYESCTGAISYQPNEGTSGVLSFISTMDSDDGYQTMTAFDYDIATQKAVDSEITVFFSHGSTLLFAATASLNISTYTNDRDLTFSESNFVSQPGFGYSDSAVKLCVSSVKLSMSCWELLLYTQPGMSLADLGFTNFSLG